MNRIFIGWAVVSSMFLWILFKHWYPNSNIVFDSYYYISAALHNDDVGAWPIGYSKFLRLLGFFSLSTNTVVVCQYVLLQISLFWFFFTARYFFQLRLGPSLVLFLFILLNPIYIFTCNLILSDPLFLAISVVWLIQLFWIIFRPKPWMIVSQAMLLFAAFALRNSALFYPLISSIAYLFSRQRNESKIAGILLGAFLVGAFIRYTARKYEKLFGVYSFSPFQGWKIANNALYVYGHVLGSEMDAMPAKFQKLDSMVRRFYQTKGDTISILETDPSSGCYFIFMPKSPLQEYRNILFGVKPGVVIDLATMVKLGPLYEEYGKYILKRHPMAYLHWFVLPSSYTYLLPYPEVYVGNQDSLYFRIESLNQIARSWFGYLAINDRPSSLTFRTWLFERYSILVVLIHVSFVWGLGECFGGPAHRSIRGSQFKVVLLALILCSIHFLFIVLAAASVYRFQLFVLLIEFSFSVYFFDLILRDRRGQRR